MPVSATRINGVRAFACGKGGNAYVVCSALGHLYEVSDAFVRRDIYPVFDVEWFPKSKTDGHGEGDQSRLLSIRKLAANAGYFINACDFDVEGETIGYNLLRYACGGKEDGALRAKFSTLTREELVKAISEARADAGAGLARAGRARHVLDFCWGINTSRALAAALASSGTGYRTVSMGRVQGPTLAFVVEREVEIRSFVPTPYWRLVGSFKKAGLSFEASHATERFSRRADAESAKARCEGGRGIVSKLTTIVFRDSPPLPFNTGDLQKEAYRLFGYTPSRTMWLAQRLYLGALISYPRTNSQRLPPAIGYRGILSRLGSLEEYKGLVEELLKGGLSPREGDKIDRAHPAIYPTGERPGRTLFSQESRLFDLIVRRFLSCFAEDAVVERTGATIDVGEDAFVVTGRRILRLGWMGVYSKYAAKQDKPMPRLKESDMLRVVRVDCNEEFTRRPPRFNQSSLLEKMERESIGTKGTRAEVISTLVTRGYIGGASVEATSLGLAITELMREYSPQIISMSLTREMERKLEEIENGTGDEMGLIESTLGVLAEQAELLKANETELGRELSRSAIETVNAQNTIGSCLVCGGGRLRIIRSSKTGKRFVGCTNYSHGCKASAPLPQRGTIVPAGTACGDCGWPVVYVRYGRRRWRLCVNMQCKGKEQRKTSAMRALQTRD